MSNNCNVTVYLWLTIFQLIKYFAVKTNKWGNYIFFFIVMSMYLRITKYLTTCDTIILFGKLSGFSINIQLDKVDKTVFHR